MIEVEGRDRQQLMQGVSVVEQGESGKGSGTLKLRGGEVGREDEKEEEREEEEEM